MVLPRELHLSKNEAQAQAHAILALCEEYGFPISNRALLWGALATATLGIYPQKIAALGTRKRTERAARQAAEAGLAPDGEPQQPWADQAPRGAAPLAAESEFIIPTGATDGPLRFQ